MLFEDFSFDGVYLIEVICYVLDFKDVYVEVYCVLKLGYLYVIYEWVIMLEFRVDNGEYVECIYGIEYGDVFLGLWSYKQVGDIVKDVGFDVLED